MTRHPENERRLSRKTGLQLGASLLVLIVTLAVVDTTKLWELLGTLDPSWLLAALALASLQFVLLGARWWFIAGRLGVPLTYRRALTEYYLSTLLNQVLPFGVLGDALRAVRHTHGVQADKSTTQPASLVLLAIMLDRASGQLALWFVVLVVAPGWWGKLVSAIGYRGIPALLSLAALSAAALWLSWVALRRGRWALTLRALFQAGGRILFSPKNLAVHFALSLALVAGHIGVFACAAHALGLALALGTAIRIVPLILVAATLPAFFAGWGMREATAAALYHLTQSSATEGVTVSLVFGAIGLVASLPGLFAVIGRTRETPTKIGQSSS